MSLFHEHKWKVASTDYTPGMHFTEVEGAYLPDLQRATMGTTHVYSKCSECGLLKQQDFSGHFKPTQALSTDEKLRQADSTDAKSKPKED